MLKFSEVQSSLESTTNQKLSELAINSQNFKQLEQAIQSAYERIRQALIKDIESQMIEDLKGAKLRTSSLDSMGLKSLRNSTSLSLRYTVSSSVFKNLNQTFEEIKSTAKTHKIFLPEFNTKGESFLETAEKQLKHLNDSFDILLKKEANSKNIYFAHKNFNHLLVSALTSIESSLKSDSIRIDWPSEWSLDQYDSNINRFRHNAFKPFTASIHIPQSEIDQKCNQGTELASEIFKITKERFELLNKFNRIYGSAYKEVLNTLETTLESYFDDCIRNWILSINNQLRLFANGGMPEFETSSIMRTGFVVPSRRLPVGNKPDESDVITKIHINAAKDMGLITHEDSEFNNLNFCQLREILVSLSNLLKHNFINAASCYESDIFSPYTNIIFNHRKIALKALDSTIEKFIRAGIQIDNSYVNNIYGIETNLSTDSEPYSADDNRKVSHFIILPPLRVKFRAPNDSTE